MNTNFKKITQSPETLAEFILKQYGYRQVKEDDKYYDILFWLRYSEDQEEIDYCNTCSHSIYGVCCLGEHACKTDMWENYV